MTTLETMHENAMKNYEEKNLDKALEIYNEIIKKWFLREIANNPTNTTINMDRLFEFTKKIAVYIYSQNKLTIPIDKYNEFLKEYSFDKDPYIVFSSRSLINRTTEGDKKFAHKSFLEYFIAIDSLEHPEIQYNPRGFEAARSFAEELYKLYIEDGNKFHEDFGNIKIAKSPMNAFSYSEAETMYILNKWADTLKNESPTEHNDINIYYLFVLWEELLSRVSYQHDKIIRMIYLMISLNKKNGNVVPPDFIMKGCELEAHINSGRLGEIQTILTFKDININLIRILILSFKKKSEEIETWIKQTEKYIGVLETFSPNMISDNPIIFPAFHTKYNKEEYVLSIGNGFIEDDDIIIKKVKNVYEDISEGNMVCVYKEVRDVQEQVNYINKLTNVIEPNKTKKIIVFFFYNNLKYYYLIDEYSKQYSNEKIINCLNNLRLGAFMHQSISNKENHHTSH